MIENIFLTIFMIGVAMLPFTVWLIHTPRGRYLRVIARLARAFWAAWFLGLVILAIIAIWMK